MSDRPFRSPYPDYDVLAKRDSPSWNQLTRKVVEARVQKVPPRRFFYEDEWQRLEAICARLLPQPERGARAIPITPWIDEKLFLNQTDGTRYGDVPAMQEAWRRGLAGIEQESQVRFERAFIALSGEQQDEVLSAVQRGDVSAAAWRGMSARRFFSTLLLGDVMGSYYAHPWAWSEIGFGGPASPRGYARLAADELDPWEAVDRTRDGGAR